MRLLAYFSELYLAGCLVGKYYIYITTWDYRALFMILGIWLFIDGFFNIFNEYREGESK